MAKIDGKYCPFYKWDENVCNPGKSDQNPTGSVGHFYKPYCQGENNWRECGIYQTARQIQEMLSKKTGTDLKPKWL